METCAKSKGEDPDKKQTKRKIDKRTIRKALLKTGFKVDKDVENARAGWYNCGDNSVTIRIIQDIINNLNSEF
jgi:hypothetical protein